MSKQKITSTTQDFTEIVDIIDGIAFFKNKNSCLVIEASSVNFSLLSTDEQSSRIYGYMSLLNSLSFPIQILIVSQKVDMSQYVKMLDQRISNVQNSRISKHLFEYKAFIKELSKNEGLLDKKVYIVIPLTPLELGLASVSRDKKKQAEFIEMAKKTLSGRGDAIIAQLQRLGLTSKVLNSDDLAKLYHDIYNQDVSNIDYEAHDLKNVIL